MASEDETIRGQNASSWPWPLLMVIEIMFDYRPVVLLWQESQALDHTYTSSVPVLWFTERNRWSSQSK